MKDVGASIAEDAADAKRQNEYQTRDDLDTAMRYHSMAADTQRFGNVKKHLKRMTKAVTRSSRRGSR